MTVKISEQLKRRFVKDYKLPIQIVQEPYFSYYLDLFEKNFKAKTAFEKLEAVLVNFKNEEAFFNYSQTFINAVIFTVSESEGYQKLQKANMDDFKPLHEIAQQKLYHAGNAGKTFVSIDLKKANFQALKFFDPKIVNNEHNYDSFIENAFESYEYFRKSKQIRQVVFGSLNPKRQQRIQKYMMSLILDALLENGINTDEVFTNSADEIVLSDQSLSSLEEILTSDERVKGMDVHLDKFLLRQIHPEKPFFVKELENGEVDFKNIPSFNMAEAVNHYNNQTTHDFDLLFFHEGRVARFLEGVF